MIGKSLGKLALCITCLFGVAACGGGGSSAGNGGPTIPILTIASIAVDEGDTGASDLTFQISLSQAANASVSADYSTADSSADQSDYTAVLGQLTIAAGATTATIAVSINGDTIVEADEEFTLALSNPVNATIGTGVATGTITNDDFPMLSIADAMITEGDSGAVILTFAVSMDQTAVGDVTVDFASSNVVATAGDDYVATNGSLTIVEGDTTAVVDVTINGDIDIEQDEQFVVNLLNPSNNVRIADNEAVGLIVNDDFAKLSIGPASVTEVDSGTRTLALPLSLDAAAAEDLVVSFATSDGTAVAGGDYIATSGDVVIPAGTTSGSIAVETVGDTVIENSEAFEVTLTNVQGAAEIDRASARGTILDNDGAPAGPQLFGFPASVAEGNSGTTILSFLLLIDQAQTSDVSVDFSTADGTAIAPGDYATTMGTATLAANTTEVRIEVAVNGDTDVEDDESLLLNLSNASAGISIVTPQLSGTIGDDDNTGPTLPSMQIASTSLIEGNSGTSDMVFAVTLSAGASNVVTVDYATQGDSATADVDYNSVNGTLTFQIGEVNQSIAVPIVGETFTEDNERFRVRLSNLTGAAVFGNTLASGTIITDEPIARVGVADVAQLEGDSGSTDLEFTVSLNVASVDIVSFDYATSDGTATAGEDYASASGSAQIAPGATATTIVVSTIGDTDNEADENFTLTLSNLSLNASFTNTTASGTLVNDDGSPGWQVAQNLGHGWEPDVDLDSVGSGAGVWNSDTDPLLLDDNVTVALFSGGVWQASDIIADINSISRNPVVTTTGSGDAIALWRDAPVESSIYTAGGSWVNATVQANNSNFFQQIAGNDNGEAIASWQQNSGVGAPFTNVWRATFDPTLGVWSAPELLESDDTGGAQPPKVAINDAGDMIAVWFQLFSDFALDGIYFDYYNAATQTWTGAAKIPGSDALSVQDVEVRADGTVAFAAVVTGFGGNPDSAEVWLYDPTVPEWTNSGAMETNATEDALVPNIAVDSGGNIFAVWMQRASGGNNDVYGNRYDELTSLWGSPLLLENSPETTDSSSIDIAADASGNAIAVWGQDFNADPMIATWRIRAARYADADQAWGPAEQIDDENGGTVAVEPKIAMDDAGNAVVVWEYSPERDIGSNRYVAP